MRVRSVSQWDAAGPAIRSWRAGNIFRDFRRVARSRSPHVPLYPVSGEETRPADMWWVNTGQRVTIANFISHHERESDAPVVSQRSAADRVLRREGNFARSSQQRFGRRAPVPCFSRTRTSCPGSRGRRPEDSLGRMVCFRKDLSSRSTRACELFGIWRPGQQSTSSYHSCFQKGQLAPGP